MKPRPPQPGDILVVTEPDTNVFETYTDYDDTICDTRVGDRVLCIARCPRQWRYSYLKHCNPEKQPDHYEMLLVLISTPVPVVGFVFIDMVEVLVDG